MDAPEDEALLAAMGLRNGDDFAPTRDNILAAMENLVSDAQPGDRFVFHLIYPSDIVNPFDDAKVSNFIMDDVACNSDLQVLLDKLPPKSRLVMIFDCCHSGTAADLPNSNDDFCPATPLTARMPMSPSLGIAPNTALIPNYSITLSSTGKKVLPHNAKFDGISESMPYVHAKIIS
ncbi:hypothetical protein NLI96_g804 [Meripilus lineatus]|uniref:Metacaspase n=1 Tax=Meripilus lineatus TaxID=2056292 RepID=A0AAD5VC14_9APHY|nr:hypothetical protein NLI96_g804 [Physisporinus lineatus]